ncbi:MAG: methylated-DNA--[protein]-cysteine S-methyltransferase [Candidatus Eisenbacteria bacterium]
MTNDPMILERAEVRTPLGRVLLLARRGKLVGLEFADRPKRCAALRRRLTRSLGPFAERPARDAAGAAARLRRYFEGDTKALAGQPLASHGTPFQRSVWRALASIPSGRTLSYAAVARKLGRPRATRAVAAANAANPVALFVPCHRVIASDGSPHGYGGGIARKRWLLAHEALQAHVDRRAAASSPAKSAVP